MAAVQGWVSFCAHTAVAPSFIVEDESYFFCTATLSFPNGTRKPLGAPHNH